MMSNKYKSLQPKVNEQSLATLPGSESNVEGHYSAFLRCVITSVFATLFFLGITLQTFAQNRTVTGKVTGQEDGSELPGVNVTVKGTTTGTVTDATGTYSLSVPGDNVTLVFSFIGYTAEEVAIGTRTTVNVSLLPDVQALQEVVVTGYTTENRRDVTGAVATVKTRELVAVPSGNVEQSLQGRVPGVTVITNGQPGTTSVVRLRGFGAFGGNEPLYVVDGVPVGSTDFLNPDDIETTTVLKDAPSASIYGARAANGVIVYTTRKGYNGKMRVTYDGVFGVTTPGKVENILNPQEQADWTWRAKHNTVQQLGLAPGSKEYNDLFKTDQYGSNPAGPVLPDYLMVGPSQFGVVGNINLEEERAKYNNDPRLGSVYLVMPANKSGTNWWNAITRPALLNRHTLGFSGGNDRSNYYVSLGMQNQEGVLIHQKFERYALRVNSEHILFKGVRFGQTLQGTYIRRQGLVGGGGGRGAAGEENNFLDAFRMPSIIPVYDAFGGYAGTQAKGFNNPRNPVAARDRAADNGGFGFGVFGNFYAEVDVLQGLTLRSSIGGGLSSNYFNFYSLPSYENSENQSTYSYGEGGGYGANWVFTNTAHYIKKFGIHSIDLLAGIESLNTGFGRSINGGGQTPFSRDPNYVNLTTTGNRVVNSGYGRGSNFFSIFGQAKYIFNDKYILTGVLRRDGSSRFGPENRYGVFPAVSAAWRVSSEEFMAGVPFVTDLKLRGGYGLMGNSNLDPTNQFSLFAADLGSSFYDLSGGNGAPTSGFYRNRIGNPAAKWETSVTSNIGIDGSFLDGKLDLVVDFWRKDTRDLLYALETPAVIGPQAADPSINIAKMRNQGIDIELTTRGTRGADFNYEVKLSGSFLHNEIVAVAPGVEYFEPFTLRNITPIRNQVGRSISAFYGYDVEGLFQNQAEVDAAPTQDGKAVGRFRFKDINGDGAITVDDRTYLGSPVPKFNGGINIRLGYKNFELETFVQSFLGVQNYNFSKWYNNFYPSFTGTAYSTAVKESFTFERGGNTVPIFEDASNFSTNTQSNSFYVENGNYLRMTNLQLAYKLPESVLGRYGFTRARIYVQSTNLFTVTKYSGLDPGVAGAADTTLGIDVGNPPVTRGYNIGLNLTF